MNLVQLNIWQGRLVQHITVFLEATPIGIASCWVSHVSTEKMCKVKRIADSLPYPLILTGDMTVTPGSEAMQLFEGTLINLTKKYQLPTTLSATAAHAFNTIIKVPCGNTLVSPDVQVHSFTASETLVSDHKPLILEFDI